jgi:hypothetical protein
MPLTVEEPINKRSAELAQLLNSTMLAGRSGVLRRLRIEELLLDLLELLAMRRRPRELAHTKGAVGQARLLFGKPLELWATEKVRAGGEPAD